MVSSRHLSTLLGAWSILNVTRTNNGTSVKDPNFGDNPTGVLIYTLPGFMSLVVTSNDAAFRPANLTLPALPSDPDHEWAVIAQHSLAYSGPFYFEPETECNETSGVVVNGPIVASTLPSFVGQSLPRPFEVLGGGEMLKFTTELGPGIVDVSIWKKLKGNVTM